MRPFRPVQTILRSLTGRPISPSSLQFRLTLELMTISVVGLAIVALWACWQMEQTLVMANKQNLDFVASRFPEQVELYSEMGSLEKGVKRTVGKVSVDGLMVWVRNPMGEIWVQSDTMEYASPAIAQAVEMDKIPRSPEVVQFGDRYVVLCGTPLIVKGTALGKVYLSQDITNAKRRLQAGMWNLVWVSIITLIVLVLAIVTRIRLALIPLEQMSQVAGAVSADDLSGAKLELQQAPDEIRGLAQAFNEMLMRLSSAWEQQRQFVGNVSHELRTPLTVVLGYLQSLLRRGTNLSDYQREALETAMAETDRTVRMLQDLLDLARADSGHLHFGQNPVFLKTLVAEVAEMSRKVSNRSIQVMATEEDVVALADQDRLQQVLINLVDNAVKYSEPDQPIDLILEKTDQWAIIRVRDRGIGISLQYQSRIFERFYRVDESMTRSRDGTGLGLAISKSLIEGMGGRITLRSKPGDGSTFNVLLPLWKPLP